MKNQWRLMIVLAVGIIGLILDFLLHKPMVDNVPVSEILIDVVGIVMALSLLIGMIQTLRQGKFGVDVLAIIAIVSTMIVRDYYASWMILIMLTGGDSLEDYATSQADRELKSLLSNAPTDALKLVKGKLQQVKVEDLKIGDHAVVKPGQQVPVDGRIVKGTSNFDQSSLTGESLPVDKKPGDNLMSGSVNGDAAVEMVVTKLAKDSEYQAIVALVKSSEAKPAKFVKMADRYAVPFTIVSLIIGIIAMGLANWNFVRFAQVMVVASPCPLILAAPVALVSGMDSMSRHHVIVKSGPTLEKLADAKTFAFDKTGTLTKNQLVIEKVIPAKDSNLTSKQLQSLAASVEQQSSHIIATSLVEDTPKNEIQKATDLKESTGNGVSATINSKKIMVGKLSYVAPNHAPIKVNSTAVFISIDGQFAGYITLKDQLRPETARTLARLRQQGAKHIMMLTGDHKGVAERIGKAVGVDDIHYRLLPKQKIEAIRNVAKDQRPVVMTGDGINDAPSLTAADVGIAMGATGASAASESADAVIMVDDLSKINDAVAVAKHTLKVASTDVLIAIAIIIALELVASTGIIPAMLGAILQEVVDLTTIVLALLAKTEPKNPKQTGITASLKGASGHIANA